MEAPHSSSRLRLGTRGSPLALTQANMVKGALLAFWKDKAPSIDIITITTSGDTIQHKPLYDIGGKGLFVKELEEALLDGRIDAAVHSCKDVPAILPDELELCTILPREDARDAFISHSYQQLSLLPEGATIGTSSPRRAAQLKHWRKDLTILPLRGNVETRLRKLQETPLDAIILAAAGLKRLGMADRITEWLPKQVLLPAGGQGAVGLEARKNDHTTQNWLAPIHDLETGYAILAERSFLQHMQGDCTTPIGVFATRTAPNELQMDALLADEKGQWLVRRQGVAPLADAENLGKMLAKTILHETINHRKTA